MRFFPAAAGRGVTPEVRSRIPEGVTDPTDVFGGEDYDVVHTDEPGAIIAQAIGTTSAPNCRSQAAGGPPRRSSTRVEPVRPGWGGSMDEGSFAHPSRHGDESVTLAAPTGARPPGGLIRPNTIVFPKSFPVRPGPADRARLHAGWSHAGHTVDVIDSAGEGIDQIVDRPSPIGTPAQCGIPVAEIVDRIHPDTKMIGITHMFLHEWPHVREIAETVRAASPDAPSSAAARTPPATGAGCSSRPTPSTPACSARVSVRPWSWPTGWPAASPRRRLRGRRPAQRR